MFSGLGSLEVAQESLSVGIGALAGSTIMLLTVPWGLSVFAGRVDIHHGNKPNYTKRPKLTEGDGWQHTLFHTGVAVTDEIRHGGVIMAITTLPYFLIQVPAFFLHGPAQEIAEGEHWWALGGT
jgi:Ca2+/Na+ antiporter